MSAATEYLPETVLEALYIDNMLNDVGADDEGPSDHRLRREWMAGEVVADPMGSSRARARS